MSESAQIERFLSGTAFAVVGASRHRDKYGNRVLRAYMQNQREVFPINPNADEVEGLKAYPNLSSLPVEVHGVSIVTPPDVTGSVVDEAIELGIMHLWMQPGAEDHEAVARAKNAGASVIAHGPCALVAMRYQGE